MSVTIRLAKFGKRHQPSYRMVVANTRDKRNGKFLDTLGHFNPSQKPVSFEYDKAKYEEWVGKGALVTDAVKKLVAGTYEFKPYDPDAKKKEAEASEEGAPAAKPESAETNKKEKVEETKETKEEKSEEESTEEA